MVTDERAQPIPHGAPGTWPGHAVFLTLLTTVIMLQATRVFVGYLVFVVDQSRRVELAAIALAVFLAIGLGTLVRRKLGWSLGVGLCVVLLGAARLTLQFVMVPEVRVILGAAMIILWGWLMTILLQSQRDAAALGLLLGMAVDVAVRILFQSIDLPWMPDLAANLWSVGAVAAMIAPMLLLVGMDEPEISDAPSISLLAIGIGLVTFHLMTGNLGFVGALLHVPFKTASHILALGTVLGLLATAAAIAPSMGHSAVPVRWPFMRFLMAVLAVVSLAVAMVWFVVTGPNLSDFGIVLGVIASYVLIGMAVVAGERGARKPLGNVGLWFTAGMVIQVVLIFAYYSSTGTRSFIIVAWVLLTIAAFLNSTRIATTPAWDFTSLQFWLAIVTIALAAVSVRQEIVWNPPRPGNQLPDEVIVTSYNIQSGFSRDNYFDLEAIARTIEAEKPNLVILQEVNRGWLVAGSVDQVYWLSHRLRMPVYFGPASDDEMWGNAILTRGPVTDEMYRKYTSTKNLARAAIGIEIDSIAGPVWVYATHLDNPADAEEVRTEQMQQLLAFWDGRSPAIIGGDFNAEPDSDIVHALKEAGFAASSDGNGATTSEDQRIIDYIFVHPTGAMGEVIIGQDWTSDHLPVTVRVHLSSE